MKVGHIYPKYVSVMECDADNLSSYFEFDKNNEPGCSLMKTQALIRKGFFSYCDKNKLCHDVVYCNEKLHWL